MKRIFTFLSCLAVAVVVAVLVRQYTRTDAAVVGLTPTVIQSDQQSVAEEPPPPMMMEDVLELAARGRRHMSEFLDDYVCLFVKQDRDPRGILNPQSEAILKVQTKLRGDTEDAPLRIYMKFLAPEAKKGREVIWGQDLFNGKMCAHEVGLLGFKRLYLDPTGFLAMQGERNPITKAGMVNLIEDLMQKGEKLKGNPDVTVESTDNHLLDGVNTQLIQITVAKPQGGEDDFSFAELAIDRERWLMLMYRSYGWPDKEGDERPLIESYHYRDVRANVGLTDKDFDPANPEYNYPAF
jgi:hypothetical protein